MSERSAKLVFWVGTLVSLALLLGMSLASAFAVAGALQTYLERVGGQPHIVAQEPIRLWIFIAFMHGLLVAAGVVVTVRHLLTLRAAAPGEGELAAAAWRSPPLPAAQ